MRLFRGLLAVAIIAALWGAPSSVSAAAASGQASTSGDERAAPHEPVSDALLLGLAGVASVAIVGTLRLLAGRRRRRDQAPENAAPENAAPSVAKDATVRRIAREVRGRAAGDPIVAALGVDDEMAARRAIRRSLRETPDGDRHQERRPRKR